MMNLKNLFFIAAVTAALSSCFGDDIKNTEQYACTANFDEFYSAFDKDSVLFSDYIYNYDMLFHNGLKDDVFYSGTVLSMAADTVLVEGEVTEHKYCPYAVYGKGGAFGTQIFGVFYDSADTTAMAKHDMSFVRSTLGTMTMVGVMVNNTAETVNAVKNGTESLPKFEKGDWLKVKFTGTKDDKVTGSVEAVLAEYSEAKDSIMVNWSYVDLQKLGNIDYMDMEISSNREDYPRYFCFDYLVSMVNLEY